MGVVKHKATRLHQGSQDFDHSVKGIIEMRIAFVLLCIAVSKYCEGSQWLGNNCLKRDGVEQESGSQWQTCSAKCTGVKQCIAKPKGSQCCALTWGTYRRIGYDGYGHATYNYNEKTGKMEKDTDTSEQNGDIGKGGWGLCESIVNRKCEECKGEESVGQPTSRVIHNSCDAGISCDVRNVDYEGHDLTPVTKRTAKSPSECQAMCAKTDGCQFWTLNTQEICWLKTSDAGRRKYWSVTSGKKIC